MDKKEGKNDRGAISHLSVPATVTEKHGGDLTCLHAPAITAPKQPAFAAPTCAFFRAIICHDENGQGGPERKPQGAARSRAQRPPFFFFCFVQPLGFRLKGGSRKISSEINLKIIIFYIRSFSIHWFSLFLLFQYYVFV